jgi:hypothetical protein
MSPVLMSQVGTMDLLDLGVISEFYGRNFLPYPFMFTRPSPFATQGEASVYTVTVPDRYLHGDLGTFAECAIAYLDSDVRVECHVQHIPAETPSVRAMAWRTGQLGFFGAQRSDEDAVDVHTVSPYDLGAAIAEAVSLEQPGRHSAIVVPEYAPRPRGEFETEAFSVNDRLASPTEVTIGARDVTVYATVQSHWRPARKWGFDRGKSALVWIRVNEDGDYIYSPDGSHARPMTGLMLQDRIDRLIADDIAILREFRRD